MRPLSPPSHRPKHKSEPLGSGYKAYPEPVAHVIFRPRYAVANWGEMIANLPTAGFTSRAKSEYAR